MDEKRILVAIAASIVIMVGWYAMFPPPQPVAPAQPTEIDQPTPREPATENAPQRAPYEAPEAPEVHLETADLSVDAAAARVVDYLGDQGIVNPS